MRDGSLDKLADPTQWHVMPVSRSDAQLMPPPAPRPRHKQRVVLSEEEYTEAVGKIIERDFFPDLPKLQQQLKLLEATKSGDARIMREVTRRILSEQRKFGMTPTPARSVLSSPLHSELADSDASRAEDAEKTKVKTNMRLDQFMAKYTSEDNAAFDEIHAADQIAFRAKKSWAYDQPGQEPGKQMLYFLPDGTAITKEEREKFDKLLETKPMIGDDLPAAPETWTFRTRNHLMFQPDVESAKDVSQVSKQGKADIERPLALPSNQESQKLLTNGAETNRYVSEVKHADKAINYKNTRFRAEFLREQAQKSGITPSPLEAPHTPSLASEAADESSAPGNYKYVAMTPSPMPGAGGESPLVTWGDISGTPLILDPAELGIDTRGAANAFTIADTPSREKLASRLEAQSRARGQNLKAAGQTPLRRSLGNATPSPSPLRTTKKRGFGELTPAAQALARRMSAGKASGDTGIAGLRKSYSGTPARTPSHTSSQPPQQRPRTSGTASQQQSTTTSSALTDGLLDI